LRIERNVEKDVALLQVETSKYKNLFTGDIATSINLETDEYIIPGLRITGSSPNVQLSSANATNSHLIVYPFKANTDYTIFFDRIPLGYFKIALAEVKNLSTGDDKLLFSNTNGTYAIHDNRYVYSFKKDYDGWFYLYYSDHGLCGVEMFEGVHTEKPIVEPSPVLNVYSKSQIDKMIERNQYTVEKTGDIFIIKTPKTRYEFKKVTKANINIDTWRLYKGDLVDENGMLHTMWQDADAEGAIKIEGEEDFVSGFHGDEIMTNIKAFIDGIEIDMNENITERPFRNITFYVTSDVYHCDDSVNKAFIRNKILTFEGDTVRVQNYYKAVENLTIEQARIATFQCHKDGSDGTQMFTHYSLNSDFLLRDVPTASNPASVPGFSKNITAAKLLTKYASIETKINKGQEHTAYSGGMVNFESTNRMKVYFDVAHSTTSINANDILSSDFEWTIK